MNKICGKCKVEKKKDDFSLSQFILSWGQCRNCRKIFNAQKYKNNKEEIRSRNKKYLQTHEKEAAEYRQKYQQKNKEEIVKKKKVYRQKKKKELLAYNKNWIKNNKDKLRIYWKNYRDKKNKTDPSYKLRSAITRSISYSFSVNNHQGKNKKSSWKYLPYSFEELKQHLESLFEPWMNWENHGKYSIMTWIDNDPSTWEWQLDHIIPHSSFNYENMECEEFKKCWSLSNLRPLSAKQNLIDGTNRTRHEDNK